MSPQIDRLESIGKPIPNVEMRIVGEEGCELATGRIGRIKIRGDHVMKGYWDMDSRKATRWVVAFRRRRMARSRKDISMLPAGKMM
jgi:acyl-CoA synthetase (AMP-forming)/AMP-acid ligase II